MDHRSERLREVRTRQVFEIEVDLPRSAFPAAPVRAGDLRYILSCIREGQCCSLVAPSNLGKSLLLKSLPLGEARQVCARKGTGPPVMVFVDCLEAGDSEHAFYELLLRRTVEELERSDVAEPVVDSVRVLHGELLRSTSDVSVRSLFASGVRELESEGAVGLVLILDEFDDVFRTLPPWPFRQLRARRDALGSRLCYVTGTSRHLGRLRSDAHTYEFRELFHLHTLVLRPLSGGDAKRFVRYLARTQGPLPSDEHVGLVIELSGGHPGLLERAYHIVAQGGVRPDPRSRLRAVASEFLHKSAIEKECRRLWDELEEEEREGLLGLVGAAGSELHVNQMHALETKGMIARAHDGDVAVFSRIFEAFIRRQLQRRQRGGSNGVRCDLKTGQIWVDDGEVTLKLSDAQRKLVRLLYQRAGAVCTYDEIAERVWGVGEGVTPGAIYELVKRVRQKVEPDRRNPSYIVTVPGEGYRLQWPE